MKIRDVDRNLKYKRVLDRVEITKGECGMKEGGYIDGIFHDLENEIDIEECLEKLDDYVLNAYCGMSLRHFDFLFQFAEKQRQLIPKLIQIFYHFLNSPEEFSYDLFFNDIKYPLFFLHFFDVEMASECLFLIIIKDTNSAYKLFNMMDFLKLCNDNILVFPNVVHVYHAFLPYAHLANMMIPFFSLLYNLITSLPIDDIFPSSLKSFMKIAPPELVQKSVHEILYFISDAIRMNERIFLFMIDECDIQKLFLLGPKISDVFKTSDVFKMQIDIMDCICSKGFASFLFPEFFPFVIEALQNNDSLSISLCCNIIQQIITDGLMNEQIISFSFFNLLWEKINSEISFLGKVSVLFVLLIIIHSSSIKLRNYILSHGFFNIVAIFLPSLPCEQLKKVLFYLVDLLEIPDFESHLREHFDLKNALEDCLESLDPNQQEFSICHSILFRIWH